MDECELVDRFSELPHSLILRILSLLPMRDVVSTTLLSKGWNKLWITVPCLNFCETIAPHKGIEKVRNFINRALLRWKGTKILKFGINIRPYFDISLACDIDLWVHFALGCEVEELSIDLMYEDDTTFWDDSLESIEDVYMAPQLLNSCSSIKKLSLIGCNLRIPGIPVWSQLKSLRIDGFGFSERLINRILLGSHQLEDFDLRLLVTSGNLNIRSTSLKRLKIFQYYDIDYTPLEGVVRICCPKLETLELFGELFRQCLLANVLSLTDATLGFNDAIYHDMRGNEFIGETLRQILPTIQHVERLGLSLLVAQELGASHKKATLSPLPNVKFLKLITTKIHLGEVRFRDTMNLLGIFPNLKMLVIEDVVEHMTYFKDPPPVNLDLSKSFLLQLKTETISRAAKKLLSMPRSSPTAKVIFNTD